MILGALSVGRAQAEARFTETLRFESRVEKFDEDTQKMGTVVTVIHEGVAGRVKFPSSVVSDREQGMQLLAVQRPELHVGVGAAPGVRVDHFAVVEASTADAGLVGRSFRVAGLPAAGQVTAHRFPVEEVN